MTGTAPRSVPPTLSIIVPTYGDGPRIYGNLVRLDHALVTIGEPYEIIVVSDGNADNTYDEARRLNAPHVYVYRTLFRILSHRRCYYRVTGGSISGQREREPWRSRVCKYASGMVCGDASFSRGAKGSATLSNKRLRAGAESDQ